jgi:hypothetical protein
MNLQLDEDQAALQDAVERFTREQYGWEHRKQTLALPLGARSKSWALFAEMGLLGLIVPESHGGTGRTMADLGIVMEQFGKALVVDPFAMNAVGAVTCLLQAGTEAQKKQLLPKIAAGEIVVAIASPALQDVEASKAGIRASRRDGQWVLSGRQAMVAGADVADQLIVDAVVDGDGDGPAERALFIVDRAALKLDSYICHDGTRGADVIVENVTVAPAAQLTGTNSVASVMIAVQGNAIAALCNEAVGAMSAAFELTLDYIRTRKQFGVPLASFQALQHRSVEMLMALERARSMAIMASVAATEGPSAGRQARLSAAKIQISESARFLGQQVIQLHGGMGMTDELNIGHYFKRISSINIQFGDPAFHVLRFAQLDAAA